MPANNTKTPKVRAFWNKSSQLGEAAGTKDLIAKKLEIEAIAKYVRDGQRILDIGCGNGVTAIELARYFEVDIFGIDYAEEMIKGARNSAKDLNLKGTVRFEVGDIKDLPEYKSKVDLAYTERALINLPDWETQKQAIRAITNLLVSKGLYVMCENSQDGLDMINELRVLIGLKAVEPPWHNRYFRDIELEQFDFPGIVLETIDFYSSTYYFLSRVVNAWVATQEGKEPSYDSLINQLALQLPPIGNMGQGRIWVWRKVAESHRSER
jgi:ubiquinone/menaquinone biosynthesis C-methylase UbiE